MVTYVTISSVFPQVSNFPSLIWRSFPGILHFNEISEVSMWSSLRHSKKRVYWKTRITCSVYWSHVTEHRCNCCNCPFFKIWLNYKTRTLSRLFSQPLYKTHLLALLCHFTDQNDKIPYPFIYIYSLPFIYLNPGNGKSLRLGEKYTLNLFTKYIIWYSYFRMTLKWKRANKTETTNERK